MFCDCSTQPGPLCEGTTLKQVLGKQGLQGGNDILCGKQISAESQEENVVCIAKKNKKTSPMNFTCNTQFSLTDQTKMHIYLVQLCSSGAEYTNVNLLKNS